MSVSEIRYSDVANYVGLSLGRKGRGPAPPKVQTRDVISLLLPGSPASAASPASTQPRRGTELPPIAQGQAGQLKSQISLLQAEKQIQMKEVKKLQESLSDSMLLEQKARNRVAKHREKHDHHLQRCQTVDQELERLRGQLAAQSGGAAPAVRDPPAAPAVAVPLSPAPQPSEPELTPKAVAPAAKAAMPQGPACEDAEEPQQEDQEASMQATADMHELQARRRRAKARAKGAAAAEATAKDSGGASKNATADAGAAGFADAGAVAGKDVEPEEEPDLVEAFWREADHASEAELPRAKRLELAATRREAIRKAMVKNAGSARGAFRSMDLNNSGSVSHQEFGDGILRLGIDWRKLTGLRADRELFKLFDEDKDHVIVFRELFPEEAAKERAGQVRLSTAEFCKRYRLETHQVMRPAGWQPDGPEKKMEVLTGIQDDNEESTRKRKWMRATMRRLKGKGKSDSRCRELVALHLPRGSGPPDRQGAQMFSKVDVRQVKQSYTDGWNQPLREATKTMVDLRDLRREQRSIIDKLYKVTEAEQAKMRAEAVSMALFGDLSAKRASYAEQMQGQVAATSSSQRPQTPQAEVAARTSGEIVAALSQAFSLPRDVLADVHAEFLKHADMDALVPFKNFPALLKALVPGRTLAMADVAAWWEQILLLDPKGIQEKSLQKTAVGFELFARWWVSSELNIGLQTGK
uniref:EF-hand domain-containing protein n=1 Tax=Zooxanthella nutricula TaxID=1333877 RepID=A0A6U6GVA4_9DINO|mmetsp:Transcript_105000/g.321728  ORF Transcript_105000/g.321728 Transcript_105000/m.321728 type:complete len:696 (+) Transcript_105000:95-2182(+)